MHFAFTLVGAAPYIPGHTLVNGLGEPHSRLAALVQPNAEQGRFGFPKPCERQTFATHAANKSFRWACHTKIYFANVENGSRAKIIRGGAREAARRVLARGGEVPECSPAGSGVHFWHE